MSGTGQFNRAACLLAATALAAMPALRGQAATAPAPAATGVAKVAGYDVVSIKPNESGAYNTSINTSDDSFAATNLSLTQLIAFAYDLRSDQLSGAPGWAESTRYDVVAKIVDADKAELKKVKEDDRRRFMQTVLAERFHLKAHTEVKTLPVYDLVLAKGGSKLPEVAPADKERKVNGLSSGSMSVSNTHLTAHDVPMATFVETISSNLQRSVLDKTGLKGQYDFDLSWTRDEMAGTADASAPPLFTALQEQLGLKLQATKGPVDTLVIDHLDKPSEN